MKAENASISVLPAERSEELLWEGLPLISCRFYLPAVSGTGRGPARIHRYYRHVEQVILRRLKELYPKLCALADQALSASLPFPICHVWTDFETAFLDERFLSIRWSLHGGDGVHHHCDLWELPWGAPISPKVLLPKKFHRKADSSPCLLRADGVYLVHDQREELIWEMTSEPLTS